MFYRNHSNKHLSIQIASLAAGLALATVAVMGGSEVLKENNSSNSATQVTPRVERVAPQFGSMTDAVYASQGITAPSQFGTAADAVSATESLRPKTAAAVNTGEYLGIGQPAVAQSFATMADAAQAVESLRPQTSSAVNTGEYLGIGQPAVGQSFATMADAAQAVESLRAQTSSAVNTGEYLGLGQPGEATQTVEPMFGTMADADYASR
jgi:hypothetical protein